MRMTSVHLAVLLAFVVEGCSSGGVSTSNHWQSKVTQVKIGMTRAEIEELLPRHNRSPSITVPVDSGRETTYWVDENWRVTITYDHTSKFRTYPKDKVTSMPVLAELQMPERPKIRNDPDPQAEELFKQFRW